MLHWEVVASIHTCNAAFCCHGTVTSIEKNAEIFRSLLSTVGLLSLCLSALNPLSLASPVYPLIPLIQTITVRFFPYLLVWFVGCDYNYLWYMYIFVGDVCVPGCV